MKSRIGTYAICLNGIHRRLNLSISLRVLHLLNRLYRLKSVITTLSLLMLSKAFESRLIHTSLLFLHCSQSPIFPCGRRCSCGSLNASETGESTKYPWVETPTQGQLSLSPVSLASRDQDDGPVELNDLTEKNRGLWTVYFVPHVNNICRAGSR